MECYFIPFGSRGSKTSWGDTNNVRSVRLPLRRFAPLVAVDRLLPFCRSGRPRYYLSISPSVRLSVYLPGCLPACRNELISILAQHPSLGPSDAAAHAQRGSAVAIAATATDDEGASTASDRYLHPLAKLSCPTFASTCRYAAHSLHRRFVLPSRTYRWSPFGQRQLCRFTGPHSTLRLASRKRWVSKQAEGRWPNATVQPLTPPPR